MTNSTNGARAVELYVDLLKRAVTNTIYEDPPVALDPTDPVPFDKEKRLVGEDFPTVAHTMVGRTRLDNLHECLETVIREGIGGDIVETGVWRGGSCIVARGVLKAHGITDRTVWVADSFEGFPPLGRDEHDLDVAVDLNQYNELIGVAVPMDEVRANFERYDLLDDQVRFLPGRFSDTMPTAPMTQIAVLRMDGDSYRATWDVLEHLYPRVPAGGFVIVDDYCLEACRQAVHDYRDRHGITDKIRTIDRQGSFWRVGRS